MYEEIEKKILSTTDKNIRQKSYEWFNQKDALIGGSTIADIVHLGPNKSHKYVKFLHSKIFPVNRIEDSIYFAYGNYGERITKILFEHEHNAEVHEYGSIEGFHPNQRYSPDGIAQLFDEYGNEKQVVLVEFKTPLLRDISDKNRGLEIYALQVRLGMETLKRKYDINIPAVFYETQICYFSLEEPREIYYNLVSQNIRQKIRYAGTTSLLSGMEERYAQYSRKHSGKKPKYYGFVLNILIKGEGSYADLIGDLFDSEMETCEDIYLISELEKKKEEILENIDLDNNIIDLFEYSIPLLSVFEAVHQDARIWKSETSGPCNFYYDKDPYFKKYVEDEDFTYKIYNGKKYVFRQVVSIYDTYEKFDEGIKEIKDQTGGIITPFKVFDTNNKYVKALTEDDGIFDKINNAIDAYAKIYKVVKEETVKHKLTFSLASLTEWFKKNDKNGTMEVDLEKLRHDLIEKVIA